MRRVLEPDLSVIKTHIRKLIFYYGRNDHWAPISCYERMASLFPDGNIHLCNSDIEHAFVMHSADKMADKVCQFIIA